VALIGNGLFGDPGVAEAAYPEEMDKNSRVLPDHVKAYQKDQGKTKSFTYRHSRIYKKALELMRLGDASVEAYENLEQLFDSNLAIMAPYNEKKRWSWV
jgi:hypothetical protein